MILGMPSPSGSLRLIWHHAVNRGRQWTRTTWAVALYLFLNLLGRLSIAALGLAYSLNEIPHIDYPITVPNWGSPTWLDLTESSKPFEKSATVCMLTQQHGNPGP